MTDQRIRVVKVTVAGAMASGKTTITQIIAEALAKHGIPANLKVAYPLEPFPPPSPLDLRIKALQTVGLTVEIEEISTLRGRA